MGNETYPKDGWAADSFPEDIEAERYEHIRNGDFSAGAENWTAAGGAEVSDGRGILRTGSATRTLSQPIAVQPNMTYTLKADIVSDGTRVTLGVRKANGSANTHEIYTDSGEKFLTFTTGKSCREMEVYVQVERYQDGAPAYVDNLSVISGKNAPTSPGIPAPEPEPAEPPAEKPEFIVNGAFADGSSGWSLSGGAEIAEGVARLASGSNTDRMTQTVQLEKGKTYTLSADIVSCGASLQFGVSDYNGRYTQLEKVVDAGGIVQLTFTTAAHIDTVKIYFQVLRYQQSSSPVLIRNVSLVEGEMGNIPEPAPEPEAPSDGTTGGDPAELEASLEQMNKAVQLYRKDSEAPPEENEWDVFVEDAAQLGVTVALQGPMPRQHQQLLLTIARECITNAVRYAGANRLEITITPQGGGQRWQFENDGPPPADPAITPGGGLTAIQRRVMQAGGTMEVQARPRYRLCVNLPKEETI